MGPDIDINVCFTLIDFLPLIKRVTQFLITPFPSNEEKK